ncbi:MAG: O-antigen ligase family protein [Anaerolineales bacterium]|nr:O-antigen ligase family protein [Anaerolineales bacterium]
MQKPEIGAYILIISVFTSISDILSEHDMPSINRPLIAITIGSVLINYILKTGRYNRFPTPSRLEWTLIAFYLAIIVSVIVSPDKSNAFDVILDITKDILVGVCIYITLTTEEHLRKGILVLIVTLTILAAMGVFKVSTGSEETFFYMARYSAFGQVSNGELRYGGPIEEPNLWGQVLVSSLPFVLYYLRQKHTNAKKAVIVISLLTILLAMIYTGSRGAIVALVAITPLLAVDMKVKPAIIVVGMLLFISLLSVLPASYSQRFQTLNVFFSSNEEAAVSQDESFAQRRAVMLTGLAMFRANPIFGVGFGNYGLRYWEFATNLGLESNATNIDYAADSRFAHSLYVEILSETGLVGFLAFLLFFVTLFLEIYRIRKKFNTYSIQTDWPSWTSALGMSITTFLISGIFLHGIFFRYIWILIGLAMAMISIADGTPVISKIKSLYGVTKK